MTPINNQKPEPIYAEPTKTQKPEQFRQSDDYQPLTIFQQNRELWQKRSSVVSLDGQVELQQVIQQPQAPILTFSTKPQSAILTRNRLQPDLVMDLPPPSQDNITPPLSSGSTSASSSMNSLDKQTIDETPMIDDDPDETLGDHFAKQNQSTLKKNEKFGSAVVEKKSEKSVELSKVHAPKIDDVVLRIEESNEGGGGGDPNRLSASSTSSLKVEKSPIPVHNTQRFVSQFADLKLTGGCSTNAKTASTPSHPLMTKAEKSEKDRASFTFGMKPAISVKPQALTKKKSIFLQAHQSPSSDRHSSSSTESNSQQ